MLTQQIEFVKDPANIDDAIDELVKYWETHLSGNLTKRVQGKAMQELPKWMLYRPRLLIHQLIVKMRPTVESLKPPNISVRMKMSQQNTSE